MEKKEIKSAAQLYEYYENQEIEMTINGLKELNKKFNNNEKLIDLHTHTNYSDGDLDPHKLIYLAMQKGIDTIAITDHSTFFYSCRKFNTWYYIYIFK